jgi:flagellar motor switch protein FliG
MLTGPEKAVLFLLSLDEEAALPIVGELAEQELQRLHHTAADMRGVPADALDETYREFLASCRAAVAVPRGGLGYIRKLSAEALGEDRARAMLEGPVTPISRLEAADPEAVGSLVAEEPPQVVAAVLARMQPAAAAEVLSTQPIGRQAAVIAHVSRMTEVPAGVVDDVARALAEELPNAKSLAMSDLDGVSRAAEILKAFGRDAARALLGELEMVDAALAGSVKQSMFTFEDLVRIGPREMRDVLREVPAERLTIALKGASDAVLAAVFAGLSTRAAELIRDDLTLLANVRRSEVEAARQEIIQVIGRLESEGKLDLSSETA